MCGWVHGWVGGLVWNTTAAIYWETLQCHKLLSNQIPTKQLEFMVHDFKGLCTVGYCHMAIYVDHGPQICHLIVLCEK